MKGQGRARRRFSPAFRKEVRFAGSYVTVQHQRAGLLSPNWIESWRAADEGRADVCAFGGSR